ncbi:glutathione peroxidase [Clostridia bacterium]|nr:glutathione peroxidase [Clostridia bacterium]
MKKQNQKKRVRDVYQFTVKDIDGNEVSLEDYRGKVLLIVNSGITCGYNYQYDDLEDLYRKYKKEGFEILEFPCNQFGVRAEGSNAEIAEYRTTHFGISFPLFAKITIKGKEADPLFAYLESQSKGRFRFQRRIKWNFTKFLLNRNGKLVMRYEPTVEPRDFDRKIKELAFSRIGREADNWADS